MLTKRKLDERAGEIDGSTVAQARRSLTRRIEDNAPLHLGVQITENQENVISQTGSFILLHCLVRHSVDFHKTPSASRLALSSSTRLLASDGFCISIFNANA